jgi:hypothetical protein
VAEAANKEIDAESVVNQAEAKNQSVSKRVVIDTAKEGPYCPSEKESI